MTPDEIRALPAGRELDALVAEKVMGWQKTPELDDELLPLYSTDIAAAWTIVEKMLEMGFKSTFDYDEDGFAIVFFEGRDSYGMTGRMGGSSGAAPLAISRAALVAQLEEQETVPPPPRPKGKRPSWLMRWL